MRNTNINTARILVYGELMKKLPDITLDDDRLTGNAYEGLWSSEFLENLGINDKIWTFSGNVFAPHAKIEFGFDKEANDFF